MPQVACRLGDSSDPPPSSVPAVSQQVALGEGSINKCSTEWIGIQSSQGGFLEEKKLQKGIRFAQAAKAERVSNRNPPEETCSVFRNNELTCWASRGQEWGWGGVRQEMLEWLERKMEGEISPQMAT